MFDWRASAISTKHQMLRLRQVADRSAYPKALLDELVCCVYPLEVAWPELIGCFGNKGQMSDLQSAKSAVARMLQRHRGVLELSKERLFSSAFQNAGIPTEWLATTASKACLGDNAQAEELEFAFSCYATRYPVVTQWAAYGLVGVDKSTAFGALLGILYHGSLDSYRSASEMFGQAITQYFGGTSNPSGVKLIQACYRPLPPLW
jgi:hypothetical protein